MSCFKDTMSQTLESVEISMIPKVADNSVCVSLIGEDISSKESTGEGTSYAKDSEEECSDNFFLWKIWGHCLRQFDTMGEDIDSEPHKKKGKLFF